MGCLARSRFTIGCVIGESLCSIVWQARPFSLHTCAKEKSLAEVTFKNVISPRDEQSHTNEFE